MLLILGLVLGIGGFVLLVLGGFNLPGRSKISHRAARSSGALFVAFLPLVFLARIVSRHQGWAETLDTAIVDSILLGLCLGGGGIVLCRALWQTKPLRGKSRPVARTPAPAAPEISPQFDEPAKLPPPPSRTRAARKQAPSRETENPFDFS